eukprot:COSAG02_NODE_482_length_21409_cov_126.131018_17_plen_66_part_00
MCVRLLDPRSFALSQRMMGLAQKETHGPQSQLVSTSYRLICMIHGRVDISKSPRYKLHSRSFGRS